MKGTESLVRLQRVVSELSRPKKWGRLTLPAPATRGLIIRSLGIKGVTSVYNFVNGTLLNLVRLPHFANRVLWRFNKTLAHRKWNAVE